MKLEANRHLSRLRVGVIVAPDVHANCEREQAMFARLRQFGSTALFAGILAIWSSTVTLAGDDGVIRVRSVYPIGETVARLKRDIAEKGIKFFSEIDSFEVPKWSAKGVNRMTLRRRVTDAPKQASTDSESGSSRSAIPVDRHPMCHSSSRRIHPASGRR